jgi:type IV pilus assembly protein PilC
MKRQKLLINFDTEDAVRSAQKVLYRYVAKNPNTGKIEKGKLSAYSKLDVHSYLLAEDYEVYEIEVFKGININIGGHYKIKAEELVFFLTQLSTYIKAGIPLIDSIKILSKQVKGMSKKDLYKSIIYELTMGDNFSEALEKQGSSFPRLLINMIKSAELAGNLAETLDDMADYYNVVTKTKKQMLSAMTYPAVISIFALSVVTFIMIFVIPQFISIYKDMDADIPIITKIIINISDFLAHNIIFVLLGIAIAVSGIILLYKNVKLFRIFVQWAAMHMPIIGKIIIYNEVTMFSKTFGSLLNHNVFITDSMEILSKITNNEIYKMLIFDTMTNIAKGEPISNSFKNHWAFPVVAYEMLVTGERTGQPGQMMNKVADYFQEEHKNAINQIKAFIEPVMIIFLAVIVGIILLSVVLPMFSMYSNIGDQAK